MSDLFSYASRATDPATSHEAERDITASGARAQMAATALRLVREHPGLTSNELEALVGVSDGRIRKRLVELEREGLVRRGEARVSRVSGKRNQTWYAVEHQK